MLDQSKKWGSNVRASARSPRANFTLLQFMAPTCPFSLEISPVYEALAVVFPQICTYRIDGWLHSRLNSRFGVRGFPSLVLLKDGAMEASLHAREFEQLVKQVANRTKLVPLSQPWHLRQGQARPTIRLLGRSIVPGVTKGSLWQALPGHFINPRAADGDFIPGLIGAGETNWVLVFSVVFVVLSAVLQLAIWFESGAVPAPAAVVSAASALLRCTDWFLASPPSPPAGPLDPGTILRVTYGDHFVDEDDLQRNRANWAVRVRSLPSLDDRVSAVLGHVRNGQTVTATGRTDNEFAEVVFEPHADAGTGEEPDGAGWSFAPCPP
jgi:thiol-disulfide isomerase/thioredoxin